jgi:hypothetical protein
MALSVKMQGKELNCLLLCHSINLKICIQLLHPRSSNGIAQTIKRGKGELPNLPPEIIILLTPINFPWSVLVFDIAAVL